ncbi:hypothetical protein LEP1GSC079_2196 [Leptospira interrogans str. FPW1039]|uniref:Uncharacterized protein n=1 Tax=Leptospira interrogans str. FPW1039 TaxID=1193040 RepID=A0A0F6I8S5_LEPIR|nr:hypothetical protein LEP1GSC200_2035 [Leptospira interrogans serovar Pomona str. CSL10083]EMJ34450.1 hypothetical protein LEP1GSC079_2196 [Leptospira interrogans str. FPW1039]EMJ60892.1 hypothetical protein LEP1GSC197_1824 [Leptospira interrogans serovar Pomona str. CSL4002]EMN99250.1 hypothetical protein LEP1GSC112_1902 [Leptospira interrogans serovar Pomona str. UT364]
MGFYRNDSKTQEKITTTVSVSSKIILKIHEYFPTFNSFEK